MRDALKNGKNLESLESSESPVESLSPVNSLVQSAIQFSNMSPKDYFSNSSPDLSFHKKL